MPTDTTSALLNKLNKKVSKFSTVDNGSGLALASHVPFGIPTMIPQLDLSLGRPGIPAGRITEFFGFEMTGKTTAGLHAIASCQRVGGAALFIDTENTYDGYRAKAVGVDTDNLLVAGADSIENIFLVIEGFINILREEGHDKPSLVVVDSITGVSTKEEMEKAFDDPQKIGGEAVAIRRGIKKIHNLIAENNCAVIFINHSVSKISVRGFGKTSDSAGGHAIKFFASIRIQFTFLSTTSKQKDGEKVRAGQKSNIKVEKNKVWSTGIQSFTLELKDTGFDLYDGLLAGLIQAGGIQEKSAGNYIFNATETQFSKREWKTFVDEHHGGPWNLYLWFLEQVQLKGLIKPYGAICD